MRELVLSIGSNDGQQILKTHLGDSKYFYIYKIFENGEYKFIKKVENSFINIDEKHGGANKMSSILDLLKDCNIVVGGAMSPNFKNMAIKTQFQPLVTKIDNIIEILKEAIKFFDELYQLVKKRESGARYEVIPTL